MKHVSADDNDLLDLVDKNDKVIGTIYQKDADSLLGSKKGLIRGVVAFIQNDKGKLWTPRRAADKRVAPNGLDFSMAEHVQSGETYEEGLIRGFKEELFLEVKVSDFKYLGKLDPIPIRPYFFTSVFLYQANDVKDYNQADYVGFEWLDPEEILQRIESGEPCKHALGPALESFFSATNN